MISISESLPVIDIDIEFEDVVIYLKTSTGCDGIKVNIYFSGI